MMKKKQRVNKMFKSAMLVGALTMTPVLVQAAGDANSVQAVMQQGKDVTGTVVDENGEPLIGATIAVESGVGAVTDFDGHFTLKNVPESATITISYIGYQTQKVPVAGKSTLQITMKPEDTTLNDVVVIGYGVQKKSNVTGAIGSIKSDDLKNKVSANAAEALQGKVSGVQVVNNSGAPGASPTIRVRGYSSNGASDPLYVVDGLKVSSIDYLEPSSIENIEVLKDAASAAIYGAEAGNGVVLITTKNGGKDGNTKITFDAQLTYSTLAKKMDVMNAKQFIEYNKEAAPGSFETMLNQYYDGKTDTDWQDELFKTGVMQKYNIGAAGNNKNGSFFVALGYMQNNGMIVGDNDLYKRFTAQLNATYNIKPWLEVGTNNSLSYIDANTISEGSAQYGQMAAINKMDPLTPVVYSQVPSYVQDAINAGLHPYQDGAGRYYGVSWQDLAQKNPIKTLAKDQPGNKAYGINGMTFANLKPFKGFIFTTRLGYRFMNLVSNRYQESGWDSFGNIGKPEEERPYLENYQHTQRYYQWENFANYNIETNAGDWGIMAGMSYSDNETDRTYVNTNSLTNEASNYRFLDYSTPAADDNVNGYRDTKRQIAYYGRLSWSFLNRYNVQVNFRADSYDAAYLDLDHNWGYFPSVSAGWVFTEENFMKNAAGGNSPLTFGKLRISYGKNGSISNLASNGGYMYRATLASGATVISGFPISPANNTYYMNGQLYSGTYPGSRLANPTLRWEESKQFDLGLDLRFFNGRLNFTMDYYNKNTEGLLVESVAPLTTGADRVWQNLGRVNNQGFEFELEWKDRIGDFGYSIKGNLATVKNKVAEYRGEGTRINGATIMGGQGYATFFEEGYPLWYIRGYQIDHIDQNTGEAIYKDLNGDGEISDADRTNLGKGIPDFTYGFTIALDYKGFDFSVYGAGASGSSILYGLAGLANQKPMFLYEDRWTESNRNASMPSALYQKDQKFYNSDAFVFSGSFFKIKQIQLGYTLPKSILKKISMDSIRAFVSLDNFFTFTDYPGNDPEVRPTDSNSMACDFGGYPISKSVSFGINVGF